MTTKTIHFLLAPDGSRARQVRRLLAREAPGLYRMAGTWPELIAQAEAAYGAPTVLADWAAKLRQAAYQIQDAFWSSSLEIAPKETLAQLDAALQRIIKAAGPGADWQALLENIPVKTRLNRRLSDLARLSSAISAQPEDIHKVANLLQCKGTPLKSIRVYHVSGSMDLTIWQRAVLQRIERDAPAADPQLQSLLETAMAPAETSDPALKAVRRMYQGTAAVPADVGSVSVIGARDSLAEAEVVAGLIQTALEKGCAVSDLGLLLPSDALSLMAVENVFCRCGIPLSGFGRSEGRRDLGREVMRQLLLCLRKPAPVMAIAALLTSPLLPWSAEEGHAMAQAVMGGDVMLKSTRISKSGRNVMGILNDGAATPAELIHHLKHIVSLLTAEELLADHLQRARLTADNLQTALTGKQVIDWEVLLAMTAPEPLSTTSGRAYWMEGLPVFHENALPWCKVRHLFVLGFNNGHYPAGTGSSAVFTDAEWEQIAASGWAVQTNDQVHQHRRRRFVAQLASATESLTLLLARRDAGGNAVEPSASLEFVARSLGVEPDRLVLDLDRPEDARKIHGLPKAPTAAPTPPRVLAIGNIELQVDLLVAFGRRQGELAPLSPSAAETLMVSPFAWLLGRLGCDNREWGPDQFDILKAGTLAHRIFEELFQPSDVLPSESDIEANVPKILQQWMLQITPFLRGPDWRVERLKFEAEILRAAIHWRRLLASCNARVVAAEQWLRGTHNDVPLHGQSDLLLQLPSGKLMVVDYKKSSSGKRRKRMRLGFDLQAHLYRMMIRTQGLEAVEAVPDDIGIVYYLLNDTTALTDSQVEADGSVPGWEILTEDISSNAMQHLDRRLSQIRGGTIQLNSSADENWWEKNAELPIYALNNSPLLRLFMHDKEVGS